MAGGWGADSIVSQPDQTCRCETYLDQGWRFLLQDATGAHDPSYDDTSWRSVSIPHDWSVEAAFNQELEGATGYLPGGIGWYRMRFKAPGTAVSYLLFEGIYNNATIYLNGEKLGDHPYGYSPFYYDISGHLRAGENVLAIRVDHSRYCDSRWYTGSGLYRPVKLVGTGETHVSVWGSFVTTPTVGASEASVQLKLGIRNPAANIEVRTSIFDPDGVEVANATSQAAGETTQCFTVARPKLWDIETPHFHRAQTVLLKDGVRIDEYTTPFGIRDIRFDANGGFFLNGRHTLLKGVCLHHDGGCVGAAVPRDVLRRRFEKLKSAGVNAIRTAHNPEAEGFLTLCDEMGILVQEEFFDEWDYPKDKRKNMNQGAADEVTRGYTEYFQEWAERDLKNVVRAHRNHPCIIQWSIGNEIEWTYPSNAEATGFFDADWTGNYFWEQPPNSREEIARLLKELPGEECKIGETAARLSKWTKEVDTTRPVIANCILPSASYLSGYADALDVIGFSYRRVMYDYGHRHYPELPIMGTENVTQWHEWKAVIERPFVAGTFLWTGIDYLGEVDGQWPKRANASGLLDTAGFERGSYHMFKCLWNDDPHVHIATQTLEKSLYDLDKESGELVQKDAQGWERRLWFWQEVNEHWNYAGGEPVVVEIYSNCDEVELFLDGHSHGRKRLADFEDRIYKWLVPFKPGTLEARAKDAGSQLQTAGAASAIQLDVDGCHIVAQLVDDNGVPVKTESREIVFSVEGSGRILGVDNGSASNTQKFQSDRIVTSQGRGLLVFEGEGPLTISASSVGLQGNTVQV